MFRIFGQFLAMIALMASAVNAQCAVSCLFNNASRAEHTRPVSVQPFHTGHACCPNQKAPGPGDQQRRQPCPNPAATVSNNVAVPVVQHQDAGPLSAALSCVYSFDLLLPNQHLPVPNPANRIAVQDPSAFSVLRV